MLFDFVHGTFHMRVQRVGVVLQRGAAARRFGDGLCGPVHGRMRLRYSTTSLWVREDI
jgi:hypothetical protein